MSRNPNAKIIPYTAVASDVASVMDEHIRKALWTTQGAVSIPELEVASFLKKLRPVLRRSDASDVVAAARWRLPYTLKDLPGLPSDPVKTSADVTLEYLDAESLPSWWDHCAKRMLRMEVRSGGEVSRRSFTCKVRAPKARRVARH